LGNEDEDAVIVHSKLQDWPFLQRDLSCFDSNCFCMRWVHEPRFDD